MVKTAKHHKVEVVLIGTEHPLYFVSQKSRNVEYDGDYENYNGHHHSFPDPRAPPGAERETNGKISLDTDDDYQPAAVEEEYIDQGSFVSRIIQGYYS